jgi:hypothetical protein
MNQRSSCGLFYLLILATVLVTTSSGGRVFARQESGAGTGAQTKNSNGAKKADATQKTNQAPNAQDSKPAQTTGAPEPKPVQDQTWGPYQIYSSIEFGFRGIGINGNGNKFRSDQNYDPGFRLFDASLMMRSNGVGPVLFDELMINTFGWSSDPNRYLRMNANKTNLYKFDANYRRIDYFNSLTNFAAPAGIPNSQHTANTQYRQGDFDLTLWPTHQKFRLNLGYSLDLNSGPSVITSRYSSDEFPVLAPVRVAAHDYRIGFDSKLWVFDLSFLQGWRFFKEDTTYFIDQQQPGNNTTNTTVIDTYQRDVPTRGKVPYTRFSLHTFLWNRLDFTGRYIYASGTTDYNFFDNLTGTNSSNVRVKSDAITVFGNAKRPNALGDLNATVRVTPWMRISDSFRVQTFRINGGDTFNQISQLATSTTVTNKLDFTTTNYRQFANTIEADFDINKSFSFHAGFRYTDRHIEQEQRQITVGQPPPVSGPDEFDNRTRAVIVGFKAKPVKAWTLYFDLEKGDNDNVFVRTGNYDYTNFRARSIVRATQRLSFNASLITKDNMNPTVINDRAFGAELNTRVFSGSADWTANEKLNLTGGYTYFHVTSDVIVQFNTAGGVVNVIPAQYFMRDHFAFITAYWQPHRRVNFYAAYRIHNDQGQGDRPTTPLMFINSYPYQLSSPEFKISVNLHRNVDWIAGYQYIDYKEKFVNNQFYQAHLPYTSLRLYIGRAE